MKRIDRLFEENPEKFDISDEELYEKYLRLREKLQKYLNEK